MTSKKLKTLLFLFIFNFIIFYFYFSYPLNTQNENQTALKQWPDLPSYQPWFQNHYVPPQSCEAYFGNGFTQRVDVLKQSKSHGKVGSSEPGWFRCFFSETLRSSVCEGGKIRMNVNKMLMSKGGEKLRNVMGRAEDKELPVFQDGAFDIEVSDKSIIGIKLVDQEFLDLYVPKGAIVRHTMRSLLDSVRLVSADGFQCSEWIEEPTLLITRFEYANLFHTFTDWYSAYVASRVTGLPNRPHVVFVDGHCETSLEEMWKALFSSVRYAKNFTSHVCFRHAILTPLGYDTAMFKGLSERINCIGAPSDELQRHPNDKKTARLSEFGELIRAAFGLPVEKHRISRPRSSHNILFVRREDYLAHPRSRGKLESRLSNEEKVFYFVKSWSLNYSGCDLNVVNGLFAHMHMEEQVRAIQDARIIIGAHGAGLAHMISALPGTIVVEIASNEFRRPHFALIAKWKGLEYHPIYLRGSYANPRRVIKKLSEIVKSLGC